MTDYRIVFDPTIDGYVIESDLISNSKTHPIWGGFCCVCVWELTLMMGMKVGAFEGG